MSWKIKNYLQELRAQEEGAAVFPPGLRHPVAFVYPNVYHLGMSNLGMHILYQMIKNMHAQIGHSQMIHIGINKGHRMAKPRRKNRGSLLLRT